MSSITTSPTTIALRFLPALACMALIYALSDQPKLPELPSVSGQVTSILGHFGAYFVLAVLLWWGMRSLDRSGWQHVQLAFAIAVLYGVSDEWHQSFVPGRQPDVLDVLTDAIGAAAGLLVITAIARSRRFGHLIP